MALTTTDCFSALADLSELLLYYPACDEFYVELIYLLAV